jgi:hypothetical protein
MYRMRSQLCEAFQCTDQELETKGIMKKFRAWLAEHPDIKVCAEPYAGEMINGEIAAQFFEACQK